MASTGRCSSTGGRAPGGRRVGRRADGDTTVAELRATSTTNEGAAFANLSCWVCRFDSDLIVEVRAYLHSMMVAYTVLRNELAAPG